MQSPARQSQAAATAPEPQSPRRRAAWVEPWRRVCHHELARKLACRVAVPSTVARPRRRSSWWAPAKRQPTALPLRRCASAARLWPPPTDPPLPPSGAAPPPDRRACIRRPQASTGKPRYCQVGDPAWKVQHRCVPSARPPACGWRRETEERGAWAWRAMRRRRLDRCAPRRLGGHIPALLRAALRCRSTAAESAYEYMRMHTALHIYRRPYDI